MKKKSFSFSFSPCCLEFLVDYQFLWCNQCNPNVIAVSVNEFFECHTAHSRLKSIDLLRWTYFFQKKYIGLRLTVKICLCTVFSHSYAVKDKNQFVCANFNYSLNFWQVFCVITYFSNFFLTHFQIQ